MAKRSPTKRPYEVERVRLTADHVDRAAGLIRTGTARRRVIEWRDTETQGLVLRIMAQSATWYLRLRTATVRIGTIDDTPLATARARATWVRDGAKLGHDPKALLACFDAFAETRDTAAALRASDPSRNAQLARQKRATWTWDELTDAFLKDKLPKLCEAWRPQYEKLVRHEELQPLRGKRVAELRKGDLEELRDGIIDEKRQKPLPRPKAKRIINACKEILTWAWSNHSRKAGLEDQPDWWHPLSVSHRPEPRGHLPTINELARTIVVAEHYRTLAEKEHATSPGTLAGLWATVLLAQRLGALLRMRQSRMFPIDTEAALQDWVSMNWSADEMKSAVGVRLPHALPLPPAFFEAISPYRKEIEEARGEAPDWLFPSGKGDSHVTKAAINRLLYRLEGKTFEQKSRVKPDRPGKPGPKPRQDPPPARENLLMKHGIRRWTPRDVRRTLASFLDDHRLGGASSAILAHRDNRKSDEAKKERALPVTQIHYSQAQKIALKAEGLQLWIDTVLQAYRVEKALFEATIRPTEAAAA